MLIFHSHVSLPEGTYVMNCHDISIRPTSWPDDVCQCLPARHRTKDHPNIVKSHGVYYERCPEIQAATSWEDATGLVFSGKLSTTLETWAFPQ